MNKAIATGMMFVIMTLVGCTSKDNSLAELNKELLSDTPVAVYSVPVTSIYLPDRWMEQTVLKDFPFIATITPFDFQGKFHESFYDGVKMSWKAVSLDKVDWDTLAKDSNFYDIIYIQSSIGITEAGPMVGDFMANIAKAYNISPSKMESLKQWIEKGGILWSEAGLRASRFETFYPYGSINDAKTLALFSKDHGTIFGLPVRDRILKSMSVDMVNYESVIVNLKGAPSAVQLGGVSHVMFQPTSFIESYPIIQSNSLLIDSAGTSYAGYGMLGKGVIITTVPTIYWHADDDGELYRWKLLSWILQRKGNVDAKFLENPKPKK
ncbi:MAG: hypothetical protein NTY39_03740 [Campylobacterales bacterium]|nr:hypothetical protein [Campylobacterales bacterium]